MWRWNRGLMASSLCRNLSRDCSSRPAKVPGPAHPSGAGRRPPLVGPRFFLSWDPLCWVRIRERKSGRLCLDLPRTPDELGSCCLLLDSGPLDSSVLCVTPAAFSIRQRQRIRILASLSPAGHNFAAGQPRPRTGRGEGPDHP